MSTSTRPAPYPLVLEPVLLEKVWGGRRLEKLGKVLPPGKNIGESWEVADMSATSAGGAGGGAVRSVIAGGALAGRTLGEAMSAWGAAMMGRGWSAGAGGFPLLVKYLDARENLSVQVHPSPAYAAAHPGAHLKTECWFIVDAEPGAVIYKGLRPGVTAAELRQRVEECRGAVEGVDPADQPALLRLLGDLVAVPVVPGQMFNLPSGTCHALGAGVLVAEVQTPSDTTYRLFDWGRRGRELHVEQAIACVSTGPAPAATRLMPHEERGRLVSTEFFSVDHVRVRGGAEVDPSRADKPAVVMVLKGEGVLVCAGCEPTAVRTGMSVVVPAACAASAVMHAQGGLEALIARV